MKKEYVKPTLLVLATEPSQIMATSPGDDTNLDPDTEGGPSYGGDDGPDESLSKGGLWDEYTW